MAAAHVAYTHKTERANETESQQKGTIIAIPDDTVMSSASASTTTAALAKGQTRQPDAPGDKPKPICIIGAGTAGLYAAMIFDELGIEYEILEASKRVGGRLFTYRFDNEDGRVSNAPIGHPERYDYAVCPPSF